MAIFIPHRCPKCFESVTLIQQQHKGEAFNESTKGQSRKADVRLKALIVRNRPKADIKHKEKRRPRRTASDI
jgi:hypothetical protein